MSDEFSLELKSPNIKRHETLLHRNVKRFHAVMELEDLNSPPFQVPKRCFLFIFSFKIWLTVYVLIYLSFAAVDSYTELNYRTKKSWENNPFSPERNYMWWMMSLVRYEYRFFTALDAISICFYLYQKKNIKSCKFALLLALINNLCNKINIRKTLMFEEERNSIKSAIFF